MHEELSSDCEKAPLRHSFAAKNRLAPAALSFLQTDVWSHSLLVHAVHTFPEHGQVWVDIFSCKGFDEIPAIDKIVDAFALKSTRVHKLERGLEYPHNVDASIPLNRTERREVTPV